MKHLLIVDDDETTLFALKKLFGTPDVAVMTADNISDALTELHGGSYDAVITDLRLTGNSGEEGLDILQYAKKQNPATKVILITGYGNSDVRRRSIQEGADYYFEKPVPADKIRNALTYLYII
jgi:DNA-binding NtrC family response regulator